MTNPEPVVVFYKSKTCGHCKRLEAKWGKETDTDNSTVLGAMKKVYPKIRTFVVSSNDSRGAFDENVVPSDLRRWGKWYPMILLVPGRVWDNAMATLGPKNSATIVDGVQIFNGTKGNNGELTYVQKYNTQQPEDFAKWLVDSMNNEEFKKHQNDSGAVIQPTFTTANGLTIPLLSNVGSEPIRPLVKPATTSSLNRTYIAAGPFGESSNDNICSMRIISRPK